MTDEDYVAELRSYGMLSTNQAADRIEALTAETAKMLAEQDSEYNRKTNAMIERHAGQVKALTAECDKYESAWMTAEGKLADAMEGLEKCQAELDEYSRQEYPLDHSVHERYRQRDYDANPARITLAALKGETP